MLFIPHCYCLCSLLVSAECNDLAFKDIDTSTNKGWRSSVYSSSCSSPFLLFLLLCFDFFVSSPKSPLGASKAFALCCSLSTCFAFCFSSFFLRSSAAFSCGFSQYSPDSSCRSNLDGCCGGGKGVYVFCFGLDGFGWAEAEPEAVSPLPSGVWFALAFASEDVVAGFFDLTLRFLNLGRNRSHDSFASFGSFANSRLIISSCE